MTLRRPLVCITGTVQELPTGDTIAGAPEGGGSGGGMTPEQAQRLQFLSEISGFALTPPDKIQINGVDVTETDSLSVLYMYISMVLRIPTSLGITETYAPPNTVEVDWGDGSPSDSWPGWIFSQPSPTISHYDEDLGGELPLHTYAAPGTYTITLIGTNAYGTGTPNTYELTVG